MVKSSTTARRKPLRKRSTAHGQRRRKLAYETLEDRRLLAVFSWDGEAGDGRWETAANWSPNGLPRDGDDVVIGSSQSATVQLVSPAAVRSLTAWRTSTSDAVRRGAAHRWHDDHHRNRWNPAVRIGRSPITRDRESGNGVPSPRSIPERSRRVQPGGDRAIAERVERDRSRQLRQRQRRGNRDACGNTATATDARFSAQDWRGGFCRYLWVATGHVWFPRGYSDGGRADVDSELQSRRTPFGSPSLGAARHRLERHQLGGRSGRPCPGWNRGPKFRGPFATTVRPPLSHPRPGPIRSITPPMRSGAARINCWPRQPSAHRSICSPVRTMAVWRRCLCRPDSRVDT